MLSMIDEIDLKILHELEENSRLSYRELSKRVNLSAPSVAERIRKMEEQEIITGYSIKIDKKKLGLTVQCIIRITLHNNKYDFEPSYIMNYPNCEYCYRVSGQSSYVVVLSVKSIKAVEDFLKILSPYASCNTTFVFDQLNIPHDIRKFFPEQK